MRELQIDSYSRLRVHTGRTRRVAGGQGCQVAALDLSVASGPRISALSSLLRSAMAAR